MYFALKASDIKFVLYFFIYRNEQSFDKMIRFIRNFIDL